MKDSILPIFIKKGTLESNLNHRLNFVPKDWNKYKYMCKDLSLISNYFMLVPMFITKNLTKKILYFCTFFFSHIYHHKHCSGNGESPTKSYYLDILFSFIHFGFLENYSLIKNNCFKILLIISLSCWLISNKFWYVNKSKYYHIIHGMWHFFIGITLSFMEFKLNY
jgi:hypothetical protein